MNLKKKILSIFTAAAMVVTMGSLSVFAAAGDAGAQVTIKEGATAVTGLTVKIDGVTATGAGTTGVYKTADGTLDSDNDNLNVEISGGTGVNAAANFTFNPTTTGAINAGTADTNNTDITATRKTSTLTLTVNDTAAGTGATVSIKLGSTPITVSNTGNNVYTATLDYGRTYSYTVTKSGYTTLSGDISSINAATKAVNLTLSVPAAGKRISKEKITEDDGKDGKSLSYVQDKAREAFEDYHYIVDEDDFEQTKGSTLSSSKKTAAGKSYTFECEDFEAESGYYVDDDIDTLTYVYEVEEDEDDEEEDDDDIFDDDDATEPTYGSRTGWTSINNALGSARTGSSVLLKMNDTYTVPASTFSSIKGKDVDVIFDFGLYAWTINGRNITSAQSVNLGAVLDGNGISSSVVNRVAGSRKTMQLELSYSGKFGFNGALTAQIDPDYAGRYANLYYYNPSTRSLEFQTSGLISKDGYATLNFNHASDYVIVVDNYRMGNDLAAGAGIDDDAKPITARNTAPYVIAAAVLTLGMIIFKQKKAHK